MIWSEKIVLPPQFVSGLNVLEVSLVKSGVSFVKDIVNVDLDSHSFPKDFHVVLTKIKGTLHFTIDAQSDEVTAKKSSDRKAMDRLSLSPRASRKLAAALETEKHGTGTPEGRSLKAGPPLPAKQSADTSSSSSSSAVVVATDAASGKSLTAGEQQALLRREREVSRREEDMLRREESIKTVMAGISKRDEAPASWKKLGTPFEKFMLSQREKLTEALASLDFSLCHEIINEMGESYEENGGVDDRASSVLSDAPDLVSSLAAAVASPRPSERSPRVSERVTPPEPIARMPIPIAIATLPPPLAKPDVPSKRTPAPAAIAKPAAQRSVAEIERDIAFAVGASDFQRAIELREELKRAGGSVPGDESADPFADGPPTKSAPPRPAKMLSLRGSQSERSGSGVSQITSGSAEELDAEINKLTNAMNATKALADKWAAIGNNGARQAAEEQVAQMQREIAELQQKRDGGGGAGGSDQYQALPAPAILPSTAPIPSVIPPPATSPAAAAAAAAGPPPRPAMRPPPRPALAGRLPASSRLPPRPMGNALPQRAASERPSQSETAAAVASLPAPPEVTVIPAAVSASDGDDPFVGRDISGPMLTIRSAKAVQTKLAASGARNASSAVLTSSSSANSGGGGTSAAPAPVSAQERAMRRRSQSLNSLMAAAKGAVPQVATVEVARAMKAAGAGEPDVDAMVSQAQRELSRQNAAAPSAELADKYILTDDSASVSIPNTQTRGSGRTEYTVYVIEVKRGASSWTVFRRFQQFEELRDKLKRSVPGGVPPDFPPKEGNKKDAGVIELRRRELEKFLNALHAHPGTLASADFRTFLAPTQLMDIKPK